MLRTELNDSLKTAMRAKDTIAVATIRLILAALKDRDIAARGKGNTEGLTDDEILQLLSAMIKQRRESIALYEQGGRVDLAEQERGEIAVIQRFLPRQLDDTEVTAAIDSLISELGAGSLKDMGRVMQELRSRYAGQMDFGKASGVVRTALSA